jgi:3-hydroxyanthranilate 3,4-dioxygenase
MTVAATIPPRKRFFNVLEIEQQLAAYDELPLILPHIDPQVTGSRNTVRQPFFLICEKDTVLAAMSGDAWVEFRDADVLRHRFLAGDFVYVPGGTPHRIVPSEPGLHVRYKARAAGAEGVAWYCERCNGVLHRIEWDTQTVLPQDGYARACRYYAGAIAGTPCKACGETAPALDLNGTRWDELAIALANEAPAVDPLAKH